MWDVSFLCATFLICQLWLKKGNFDAGENMEIWPHLGLSEEQIIVMQGLFSALQGVCCV